MVLTDWADIGAVLGGVFVGIAAILILVVHLEQWLGRTEAPNLAALRAVRERDQEDDVRKLEE
ncbi:MAG: hypothetical protein QOF35_1075 [Actinomycetota bacterium]|jgi:hypothetical protein|nr:hypothetical protein [Actinomycetota bacterium]